MPSILEFLDKTKRRTRHKLGRWTGNMFFHRPPFSAGDMDSKILDQIIAQVNQIDPKTGKFLFDEQKRIDILNLLLNEAGIYHDFTDFPYKTQLNTLISIDETKRFRECIDRYGIVLPPSLQRTPLNQALEIGRGSVENRRRTVVSSQLLTTQILILAGKVAKETVGKYIPSIPMTALAKCYSWYGTRFFQALASRGVIVQLVGAIDTDINQYQKNWIIDKTKQLTKYSNDSVEAALSSFESKKIRHADSRFLGLFRKSREVTCVKMGTGDRILIHDIQEGRNSCNSVCGTQDDNVVAGCLNSFNSPEEKTNLALDKACSDKHGRSWRSIQTERKELHDQLQTGHASFENKWEKQFPRAGSPPPPPSGSPPPPSGSPPPPSGSPPPPSGSPPPPGGSPPPPGGSSSSVVQQYRFPPTCPSMYKLPGNFGLEALTAEEQVFQTRLNSFLTLNNMDSSEFEKKFDQVLESAERTLLSQGPLDSVLQSELSKFTNFLESQNSISSYNAWKKQEI